MLLFVLSGLVAKTMMLVPVGDGAAGPTSLQAVDLPVACSCRWRRRETASLLYALTFLALLYALLAWLHRRRWYWSV